MEFGISRRALSSTSFFWWPFSLSRPQIKNPAESLQRLAADERKCRAAEPADPGETVDARKAETVWEGQNGNTKDATVEADELEFGLLVGSKWAQRFQYQPQQRLGHSVIADDVDVKYEKQFEGNEGDIEGAGTKERQQQER